MPSPTTTEEFLDLVRKSEVVESKRLEAHVEKLRTSGSLPTDVNRLAGVLVRDGLLTQFQAEQLLLGKWRRFNLGKYRVLERLGAGGMGSVFLCEHKLMRRRVAVKVLPTAKAEDESSRVRFYREARVVAALDHPNIVRAYDIDQDDKLHFLVMEHVDGASLQEIVKKRGPLSPIRAAHYIRQAALGLQHAHEAAGIVHRDIKPGNILVDRNGIVKVLDMGLARFFHDEEDLLTKQFDENVLGTADYLAPEQAIDSHSVDIRADIYSLGATFYFCLTGRTPFSDGTTAQKLIWHQTRQPRPIKMLRNDVPDELLAVIDRMMAKDPSQRYPTPQAVAEALIPWTQTPIPPPPEEEMPQLSLAAKGAAVPDTRAGGPTTTGIGPVSPTPARKVWQVTPPPAAGSPPPATPAPPATAPAVAAAPPVAPLAPPAVPAAAPPVPPAAPVLNRASHDRRDAGPTAPPAPAAQPALNNGLRTAPAAAPAAPRAASPVRVSPAPRPAPLPDEEDQSWEKMAPETEEAERDTDSDKRIRVRPGAGSRKRLGAAERAAQQRRRFWRVVGIAAGVALLGVAVLVYFAFFRKPATPTTKVATERPPLRVNSDGEGGAYRRLRDALAYARDGDRIIVESDISEANLAVDSRRHNLTIEAAPGKPVVWKCPDDASPAGLRLLTITHVEGFQLRGLTLDGNKKAPVLLSLYGPCPGLKLEKLTLGGYSQHGIQLTNGEGGKAKPLEMLDLTFDTPAKQSALFFTLNPNTIFNDIKKIRFISVRDCRFKGPGSPLRTPDPSFLDTTTIDLPKGVTAQKGS